MTGAGTGIGRACALALLEAGWSVALAGRRREALEETAGLAPPYARTLVAPADVAEPAEVDGLFARLRAEFGRLDLLFNNAGLNAPGVPFEDLSHADWTRIVAVNLTGSFLCAQGAFRLMRDQDPQGGRIVNNGSISAHAPRPDSAPYTATKHAVTGLTKALSLDGRRFNIACGQIDIGNAATPMTQRMQRGVPQADGRVAVEPVMDVADVGRMLVHMAELPLSANVQTVTLMATAMPFVGRG